MHINNNVQQLVTFVSDQDRTLLELAEVIGECEVDLSELKKFCNESAEEIAQLYNELKTQFLNSSKAEENEGKIARCQNCEASESELFKQQQENRQLGEKLRRAEAKLSSNINETMISKVQEAVQIAEQMSREKQILQAQLRQADESKYELRQKIDETQRDLREKVSDAWLQAGERYRNEINQLKDEINKYKAESLQQVSLQADIQRLNAENNQIRTELKNQEEIAEQKIVLLTQQLIECKKEKQSVETRLEQLGTESKLETDGLRKENQWLKTHANRAKSTNDELNSRLFETSDAKDELSSRCALLERENTKLREKFEDWEKMQTVTETSKLIAANATIQAQKLELEALLKSQSNLITKLRIECKNLGERLENLMDSRS